MLRMVSVTNQHLGALSNIFLQPTVGALVFWDSLALSRSFSLNSMLRALKSRLRLKNSLYRYFNKANTKQMGWCKCNERTIHRVMMSSKYGMIVSQIYLNIKGCILILGFK